MSASIAICLPGMASRVKRAPTSAIRVAPLVITMKLTMIRMAKTTRPMKKSPPMTNCEKPPMTWPAAFTPSLPCEQDDAGRRDVERQAQHRGEQQHRREGRELQRLLDPQRHHQDEDRQRDRQRQPHVDHEGRDRNEQDRQDEHDRDGKADVAAALGLGVRQVTDRVDGHGAAFMQHAIARKRRCVMPAGAPRSRCGRSGPPAFVADEGCFGLTPAGRRDRGRAFAAPD